jgi:uncharacterized protein (DUF58 family)
VTSEGARFLLFSLAVGVAAMNTGNNLFYLLLAMMLSLVIVSGVLSEFCVRSLEFRRHVPEYLVANEPTMVSVTVANRKTWMPSFSLRVFEVANGVDVDRGLHLPYLPAQSRSLLSYPLLANRRGAFQLDGFHVVTPFPFGLFLKKALYPTPAAIWVCPEIRPLPTLVDAILAGQGQDYSVSRRGHGVELYNLRLYRPGDDSRTIHWTTTARTSRLIVRETEAEDQRRLTLIFPAVAPASHDEHVERGAILTASIAAALSQRDYHIRALIGEEELPACPADDQLAVILQSLARCERRNPIEAGPTLDAVSAMTASCGPDESAVVILAWADRALTDACLEAHQILHVDDYAELFDAAPASLPA